MTKRSIEELSLGPSEVRLDSPEMTPMLPTPEPEAPQTPQRKVAHLEHQYFASEAMKCTLPPHRSPCVFSTYEDYEVHYKQFHVNRCSECGKNFPSERFLNLHIEENHDPLMEAKRARGEKTYGCFVEDCEKRCSTPQKRRLHLIDKHMFPRKYNFFIVNDGIDRHMSMLKPGSASTQPRRISLSAPTLSPQQHSRRRKLSLSVNEETQGSTGGSQSVSTTLSLPERDDMTPAPAHRGSQPPHSGSQRIADEMADLTTSMSALKFVPKSVTLRQQKARSNDSKMSEA